jgi:putative ABC transport system permease protein
MKAFGFRDSDITAQYVAPRSQCLSLIIGIVLGTLLANTLGEALAGVVISSFVASSFRLHCRSALPAVPVLSADDGMVVMVIATIIGTSGHGKIKNISNI